MKKSVLISLLSLSLLGSSTFAARTDWEKVIPKCDIFKDSCYWVIYAFTKSGREFTTGKYLRQDFNMRGRAVQTAISWDNAGYQVGYIFSRNKKPTEAEIKQKIAASYKQAFGKELEPRGFGDLLGKWRGIEGNMSVTFELLAQGRARAYDKSGTWYGTWRKTSGTGIQIDLSSPNTIRYVGSVTGSSMRGTARNLKTGRSWSFQISRSR